MSCLRLPSEPINGDAVVKVVSWNKEAAWVVFEWDVCTAPMLGC